MTIPYEAYAVNIETGAVSHYTHYPFDNILRFGDTYYGVASNGLFEIGGEADILDAALPPQPIDAHITTFQTDFGSNKMKRLPAVYLSGRAEGGVTLGVTADEGETYDYESDWGEVPGATNHRVVPGKGIKGVYYRFDVSNVGGASLEIGEISVNVEATSRAV